MTHDGPPTRAEARERSEQAPGSALSSLLYDPMLALGERAGMAARRRRLLAEVRGDVLELGAGTGLNLRFYPPVTGRVVLTEPDEHMAGRLRSRVEERGAEVEVVRAPGEALPFDAASFDTVVATLVLCTVQDVVSSIAEIRRVLRPGGPLLFIEHVRSDSPGLARWQDRLRTPWKWCADGCRCNQSTVELLRDGGFDVEVSDHDE